MTLSTSCCARFVLASLASAPFPCVPALAAGATPQRQELEAEYPSAPRVLPAPGASSGLLLVDINVRFPFGGARLVGAAVVATDSTAFLTRAKSLSRHVVLFHDLPGGVHALRFVIAETAHAKLALEVPPTSEFTVSVTPGGISYLGTATVQKKIGLRPPEVHLVYDLERERDSWAAFLQRYANTPWADLVRARLDSLERQ